MSALLLSHIDSEANERHLAKLAVWRWGGFLYIELSNFDFAIGIRQPEQGRHGHFTGIQGWIGVLLFRLGFHDKAGWECHFEICERGVTYYPDNMSLLMGTKKREAKT